MMERPA